MLLVATVVSAHFFLPLALVVVGLILVVLVCVSLFFPSWLFDIFLLYC